MISKLSTFVVFAVVVGYVASAAVIAGSPKSSEISASHLRAMAGRNKRASMGILPGRLRYDEQNQRRVRKNFGEPTAPIFEESSATGSGEASVLAELTTEQLYRMLDLLNRIENQEPVDASPHELATLNYLLQSYQN